jgi:hypothetical protein
MGGCGEKFQEMERVDRRAVLAGAAALAVLPTFAWGAGPPPVDAILQASSKLTGIDLDRSYIQLADAYWRALTRTAGDSRFATLVSLVVEVSEKTLPEAIRKAGLEGQAQALTMAWYSGMVDNVVITYDDAVAWQAAPYTKPAASCGGLFGYWNAPPGEFVPGQEDML